MIIDDFCDAWYMQHCVEVSRTLYAVLLETFPSKEPIWRAAAQLEMQHGSPQQVKTLLCHNYFLTEGHFAYFA
jgi:hypothetical protein